MTDETNQFTLEKFNPTTNELKELADKYRWLKICWIEDWKGMDIVLAAKNDLVHKRTYISKSMKSFRDSAILFQKNVISKEKELLAIIWWVEEELKAEIQAVEDEKERLKRIETLPVRYEELRRLGLETQYDDTFVLSMSYKDFCDFIILEKARIADEIIQKQEEEKREAQRQIDLKAAEERWRKEAEARLKDIENQKEIEQANKEKNDEIERQAKERKEKEEQEKLEKATKYKKWLKDNWYTEENKEEYQVLVDKVKGKVTLWKFISEFAI